MSRLYTYIGKILYGPKEYDIWAIGPDLAASWEHTRLQCYPDYAGPPPTLLDEEIANIVAYNERIAGYAPA